MYKRQVHAHVRRALIGALAQDLLHERLDHGERLDVAVVVDRGDTMRLEMERVDDVRVVEVDRRCLVRDVDGMRERQVPHGEGLELGIALSLIHI